MIWQRLGVTANQNAQYDTSLEVASALNLGLRQVAADMPWTIFDTIALTSNTWDYTISSSFTFDGHPDLPFAAMRISSAHDPVGVTWSPVAEYGNVPFTQGVLSRFNIKGRRMTMNTMGVQGQSIVLEGPGDPTPVDSGLSLLTSVPEDRLPAAVLFAVSILAFDRSDQTRSAEYKQKYDAYVMAKTGRQPTAGGQ